MRDLGLYLRVGLFVYMKYLKENWVLVFFYSLFVVFLLSFILGMAIPGFRNTASEIVDFTILAIFVGFFMILFIDPLLRKGGRGVVQDSSNKKYPSLTQDEVEELFVLENKYINEYGMWGMKIEHRIAMALGNLATKKLTTPDLSREQYEEAKRHFLKADIFDPDRKYSFEANRVILNLPLPLKKPEGYREPERIWSGFKEIKGINKK